jgi:hypothetical protein
MLLGNRFLAQIDNNTIILEKQYTKNPFTGKIDCNDIVIGLIDKYPFYVMILNYWEPANKQYHAFYCCKRMFNFQRSHGNKNELVLSDRRTISELEILAKSEPVVIHL